MNIKIITNFGTYIIKIPKANPHTFNINEFAEEILETCR